MLWTPAGSSTNPCQGVNDYIASRAGPSPTFILINEFFFYGFLMISVLSLGLWIIFRQEPRLQSRSFSITFGAFSVVLLSFIVICARRTELGSNGGFAMSCQVHFWLYTSMGSMQSCVGLLRLIQLLNTARFARGARKLKRIVVDDSDTRSHASSARGNAMAHVEDISAVFRLGRALAFSFGFGAAANRIKKGSSRQFEVDAQADILALELSSQSLRGSTMFAIFVIV